MEQIDEIEKYMEANPAKKLFLLVKSHKNN